MPLLQLKIDESELVIHRLSPDTEIPAEVLASNFVSITRTRDELSIVSNTNFTFTTGTCESGWCSLQVVGPLDFSLTGILAGISSCLAAAGISIFAISTYDTDYILIRKSQAAEAVSSLSKAGYDILNSEDTPQISD